VLATLEGLIGRPAMDSVMKTYFERWKFRHPCGRDFRAVFDEIVPRFHGERFGASLSWFFDQLVEGTNTCDYELTSIRSEHVQTPAGIFDSLGTKVIRSRKITEESKGSFRSRVLVSRLGEVELPVTVRIGFDGGDTLTERWDGKDRWKEFTYIRPDRVIWATVDPDQKIFVDTNYLNNSKAVDPESFAIRKYFVKMLFWIQNALQTVAIAG
jgi:hypothetical protein